MGKPQGGHRPSASGHNEFCPEEHVEGDQDMCPMHALLGYRPLLKVAFKKKEKKSFI